MKLNNPPPLTCSTREAAVALGISVRTAQLWVEEGRLQAWKTPGGHRRILRSSVDQLCQQQQANSRVSSSELAMHVLDPDGSRGAQLLGLLRENFPGSSCSLSADTFDALLALGGQTPNILIADLTLVSEQDFRFLATIQRHPRLAGMLLILLRKPAPLDPSLLSRLSADFTVLEREASNEQPVRLIKAYNQGRQHLHRAA